jgi:hypothetical protein
VLRRIFGPKAEEIRGGWRKLYNKELRNLSASVITVTYWNDQIKKMR